ncbi:hypothetical protein Poli38472_002916 [Pythium oligandrum]|uniref:Temptin Cys/Cys disulfide domain-containing protein n=1 Tax=Pythium oligandrum TaxID=41045 RepID=A0A8K1C5K3_PYTOL|nr:hypothetical protein Poli38472_002916 [Pythium oligandrum]|eukprot:TMW56991.1 hypothetical protein Poli38472_002916 [Pythium oligandrum]
MKTSTTFLAACAVLCVAPLASARPEFVQLIPNGDNVEGVQGLGHKDKAGGGSLNDFGKAFSNAGQEWTKELCEADSDGDGQTNGQELGDPCCKWTKGGTPSYTKGVSHPGDATSKADSSLWANVKCSSDSSSNTTASSSTGESPAGSSTPATTTPAPSAASEVTMMSCAVGAAVSVVALLQL